MGGPGSGVDRNYHCSIENDVSFIAERTNTNVGLTKLFYRHDNLWMNGRVRSMNLCLNQSLIRHEMSHIGVARDDYMMHVLHFNS
jgi:hypothetical protein